MRTLPHFAEWIVLLLQQIRSSEVEELPMHLYDHLVIMRRKRHSEDSVTSTMQRFQPSIFVALEQLQFWTLTTTMETGSRIFSSIDLMS